MTKSKVLADYLTINHYTTAQLISFLDEVRKNDYPQKFKDPNDSARELFILGLGNVNTLFPNLNISTTSTDPKDYIGKWLRKYYKSTLPSQSIPNPKGSADDPAVGLLVNEKQNYTPNQLVEAIKIHNLFMSAENVQGALLEEYISQHSRSIGWIWAKGESMRACDFIRRNSNGITELLQIKNRDNTENSSSSAIRQGTQIIKWNRLKTIHKNKKPLPQFNWDDLNKKMDIPTDRQMSESDYRMFLRKTIQKNPNLITG
ncbi:SinI family restriction endonuclease [Ligilactobacillus acidipiscis]|uniref:SinI family restriction endonuclease n=1 Tax=Ligilactobacillus acidipiscis TaxID=89059 RepID=UPI003865465B